MLQGLGTRTHPRLLIGMEHPDDGAVIRLPGGDRIVQSVDIIAPIVNDPAVFGRIACANALSDIYAMGGQPMAAMNISCFPSKKLDLSLLRDMMEGAEATLTEADTLLVGGHTVDDPELKMGFSVTGLIKDGSILSIQNAQANDVLVLTKPLGTGVVNQALRKDKITDRSDVYLEAQTSMATLNARGAEAARAAKASAMTDVTGFGLLGHGAQFARASQVTFEIDIKAVPAFDGVRSLLDQGLAAGRAKVNRQAYEGRIQGLTSDTEAGLLFDPQTSGGLLVALAEAEVEAFRAALSDWSLGAAVIGRVVARTGHDVIIHGDS